MGACKFCRKTRGTTGSYPWKASNSSNAHFYETMLRPEINGGLIFTSDLEKEGCRLLPLLTLGEQMLIARITPVMVWWELSCTAMGYAGYVCNKVQNIDMVASKLPRDPARTPLIIARREPRRPGDAPRETKVRSWVIAAVLTFLRRHNPAYNGSDPFIPVIEIDDECLRRLPGAQPGDEPGEVDWSGLAFEAAQANSQYAGVPAAALGTGDTGDTPAAQSGLGRDENPSVDQDELLKRVLGCAATGDARIAWPTTGEDVSEFTCLNYHCATPEHHYRWRIREEAVCGDFACAAACGDRVWVHEECRRTRSVCERDTWQQSVLEEAE